MDTFNQLKMMQREREKAQEKMAERLKTKPKIQDKSVMAYGEGGTKTSALDCLRAGKSLDIPYQSDLDRLPIDWRIEYEERAAILEYDGGLTRENAEMQALTEISERIRSTEQI